MPSPRFSSRSTHSPRHVNTRELALDVLMNWEQGEEFATNLVDREASAHHLEHRDAALLQALVFGTLRNITLLDHWLEQLCNNNHLEHRVHWLLRLGLTQILLLDHAPHAAVNETVNLADGKARGLINAILRRTLRERETLLAQLAGLPLDERYSHPDWLVDRWLKQFGPNETELLCQWNQKPAPTFIRLNQLHPKPVDAGDLKPASVPGFYIAEKPPLTWLQTGQCYVQDPSTSHACRLLDAQPGELILDACAAPGGKTALIAQMMQNQGRIIACDSSSKRLQRMRDNLQRLHASIAEPVLHDWTSHANPGFSNLQFDRILIDAPCSNTGVMRRRLDVRWRLEPEVFAEMQKLQLELTNTILPYLKSGGQLVYSTCSLDRDENEIVVQKLLAQHPGLQLQQSHTALPWRDQTDGAFAALLIKS